MPHSVQGNIGDLLLPSMDSQPPTADTNMDPSSTGERTGFVYDRKRTWTGVSSTLAGLAASDWSLEDASSMSDWRVTQNDSQEEMPTVLEEDRRLDQPSQIYQTDSLNSPRASSGMRQLFSGLLTLRPCSARHSKVTCMYHALHRWSKRGQCGISTSGHTCRQ